MTRMVLADQIIKSGGRELRGHRYRRLKTQLQGPHEEVFMLKDEHLKLIESAEDLPGNNEFDGVKFYAIVRIVGITMMTIRLPERSSVVLIPA